MRRRQTWKINFVKFPVVIIVTECDSTCMLRSHMWYRWTHIFKSLSLMNKQFIWITCFISIQHLLFHFYSCMPHGVSVRASAVSLNVVRLEIHQHRAFYFLHYLMSTIMKAWTWVSIEFRLIYSFKCVSTII